MNLHQSVRWAALASLLAAASPCVEARTLSLPDYECNPGATLLVPVNLDDAAGLAGIRVQVNFDPQVVALTGVEPGPLGASFEMSEQTADGSVTLDFVRATVLASGSGRLALLRLTANPGATTDLYTDLAVALFEISDETGVRDLTASETLGTKNGAVAVSLSGNIDNERNGLPDWWETQYGLDLFASAEIGTGGGFGLCNLLIYAFGGSPLDPHDQSIVPQIGSQTIEGHPYLTLTFFRRKPPTNLVYVLEESEDLIHWSAVDPEARLVATPLDVGGGIEKVTVYGNVRLDSLPLPGASYMRIRVNGGVD